MGLNTNDNLNENSEVYGVDLPTYKGSKVLDSKSTKLDRKNILEKCLESRVLHKYSEFKIDESKNTKSSSNGWFAQRGEVEFFIKPLDINNDYSIQSFVTEAIAGPLYRLALFGKSPKVWLIKGDQSQVYLGSEFLPNFNTFADLFKRAVTESKINSKNCLEEQIQHEFKKKLRKSAGNSRQFAKFLAACLIFREFDFNLGNFGIIETNGPGIAEKKWAKIDHGLSFEYKHFDSYLSNVSSCSEILEFYLQDRKYLKDQILDNLLKEILAELVDYSELSEELGNMCKFLEESKALIEQLIDKQIADLEKNLRAEQHNGMTFIIDKKTFSYTTESGIFTTDQDDKLNEYFKKILYDQVKKAKGFSEELSKGSNSEVVVTESNSSDDESEKTVASSIQQARIDDLIQGRNQPEKEPNSTQGNLDRKIAELKNRKLFTKEGKNDTLSIVGDLTQNFISYNFMEGKMPTNTEQQVENSLGQEELESMKNQLENLQKELDEKISKEIQLTEEKNQLKSQLNGMNQELEKAKRKNRELKDTIQELSTKNTALEDQNKELEKLKSENENKSQQLEEALKIQSEQSESQIEGLKTQLNNKNKELDDANQKVVHLKRERDSIKQDLAIKTRELDEAKAQLEENERKLDNTNKNVLKLAEDLRVEKLSQQVTVNNLNGKITQLTQILEKTKKQLKESESENNDKFLEASTNKRQGNYASVSFVLSGAFAVGASLTMFHLAMCISLAVAALTFLAVGCYCSYKANTALSDVKIDQQNERLLENSL